MSIGVRFMCSLWAIQLKSTGGGNIRTPNQIVAIFETPNFFSFFQTPTRSFYSRPLTFFHDFTPQAVLCPILPPSAHFFPRFSPQPFLDTPTASQDPPTNPFRSILLPQPLLATHQPFGTVYPQPVFPPIFPTPTRYFPQYLPSTCFSLIFPPRPVFPPFSPPTFFSIPPPFHMTPTVSPNFIPQHFLKTPNLFA